MKEDEIRMFSFGKTNIEKEALKIFDEITEKSLYLDEQIINQFETFLKRNRKEIKKAINSGVQNIRDIVFNVLFKLTDNILPTGQLHIYRGMLSPHGNYLKALNMKCVDDFVKRGAWSEEEAKTYKKDLQESIKEAG